MKYKAVIFDLDGTLLDTIQDIGESVNASLKKHNHKGYSIAEYKYFVGRGIDETITTCIKKGGINPTEFDSIKKGYMEEYKIRHNLNTKPYDGIVELLNDLKESGVKVNVLSNKPHHQTLKSIKHYFHKFKFDFIYGKKPEFRIKPYPESIFDMIEKLGIDKKDILYIGDTNTDIQTANNAGLTSVGVLWGFRDRLELEKEGATYIVDKPSDILKIVNGE